MKIIMIILMFLIIGALFVISNENLHLNDKKELERFYDSYYLWVGNVFNNLKSVTADVIKVDWLPKEK